MWLTYAPIPNYTASYYNVPVSSVDWFSMSFFAVSLVVGFFSIFVLDRWGLKVSVSGQGWLAGGLHSRAGIQVCYLGWMEGGCVGGWKIS